MKEFHQNPFFYFGLTSVVLLGLLFVSSDSLAEDSYSKAVNVIFSSRAFLNDTNNIASDGLFFSQNKELALETPDLKIGDNSLHAVSTPSVLTAQTLGDIFGGSDEMRKEVVDYTIQIGDTVDSVAKMYGLLPKTIRSVNDLSSTGTLKVGQTITILPVDGLVHVVKNGDTISQISKIYKSKIEDIVAYNNLINESDIFIGDILIVPNGVLPSKALPQINIQVPVAGNYYIHPTEGVITQGLHFENGVDIANKAGTSIYAAASGAVQRAVFNGKYNFGMGNYITILHSNGTVTYYGHLETVFVKSGDRVNTGDRIALMGQTGKATGRHLHFQVLGARNPYEGVPVGTYIKYKP
ncbi:MAG: M23 family metallopeptidase [Candidatus Staskawiczbacteria bacterium]|nr:M23 family metallopeptidase [Candidatus Staskawiczbacteria bacterium]